MRSEVQLLTGPPSSWLFDRSGYPLGWLGWRPKISLDNTLIEFRVKNFRSLRDAQAFGLVSSADQTFEDKNI